MDYRLQVAKALLGLVWEESVWLAWAGGCSVQVIGCSMARYD
jgi:hypothetical protein